LSAATATTHAHTLSHTTPEKKSCSIELCSEIVGRFHFEWHHG
jgi:hypothetical protein